MSRSEAAEFSLSVQTRASAEWDDFVRAHPRASIYLRSGWSDLIREVFAHRPAFIEARDAHAQLVGILPMVQQRSVLLGNFATSMPFFNYGGALSQRDDVVLALMTRARDVAQTWGCSYLELRDAEPRPGNWNVRTDKVSMILQLPATFDALSKQLGSKLRSQVKRTDREQSSVTVGGAALVDAFYDVFAENMRDLGTPVYPKKFFHALVTRFPDECHILTVTSNGQPAAAAFLVVDGKRAEIPWASCRAAAKPLGFNMKLYWEVLRWCIERGCSEFDFGRSTADSGTFKFKKQWGAEPQQLYWHRWEKHAAATSQENAESQHGSLMARASEAWKRLPLPVANAIGPLISPKLPW